MKKIYLSLSAILMSFASLNAQQTFSNFQAASLVIGQANFTVNSTVTDEFTTVNSGCSDISSKGMFVVGAQTGRVLIYNSLPSVNGASASVVVGRTTFSSTTSGCTQNLCSNVNGVCFSPDGKKLIVSDFGNNRVLIWNSIPTVNGQNADVVIGQTSFTTNASGVTASNLNGPTGISMSPAGQLFISDYNNNRVLVFNSIPNVNGASANFVIGQTTFTTNTSGAAANQLASPWNTAVSPSGKLLISDAFNHRVLVYNTIPTSSGASADVVIGQTGFGLNTSGLAQNKFNQPYGLTVSPDGKLAVGEWMQHRITIFNTIPTSNGANADVVLGQPDFTTAIASNGGISAQSMNQPYSINFDLNGRLFVNGRAMNRTMVFGSVPTQTAELAVTISASSTSLCAGSEIKYDVVISNNGSSAASNVIANAALPVLFNLNGSIANTGVYSNGFWTIPTISSGSSASLTLLGTVNSSVPQTLYSYANLLNSQQFDSNLSNNGTSATVNISSGTPPSLGSISGPSLVCTGNSAALAVNGVTNVTSYQWTAVNASVSSSTVTANVTFGTPGVANVFVLPSNANCTGTTMNYSVTVSACTGLNEDNLIAAKVYPNPTNGILNIETTNAIESIQILDINGKLVVSENNVNTNNITMNVGSLNNGVYLLRAKLVSGEVANSRIVLQK